MGWQLIEAQSLQSSAASVTFSNIPQTFKSLKLMVSAKSDYIQNSVSIYVKPNGATTNISARDVEGDGTSALSHTRTDTGWIQLPAASATANTFGNACIEFPNYASTVMNKPFSADSSGENNATGALNSLVAALWSQTAAISSLTLATDGNYIFGSTFTLYGLA